MFIKKVKLLVDDDFEMLLEESRSQGYRMIQKLLDEYHSGRNRFDKPGEALYVAIREGEVIAVGGLNIDPYLGQTDIGRVRHLYVLKKDREIKVGTMLLKTIIDEARQSFELLTLYTDNPVADQLYKKNGFANSKELFKASHVMRLKDEA